MAKVYELPAGTPLPPGDTDGMQDYLADDDTSTDYDGAVEPWPLEAQLHEPLDPMYREENWPAPRKPG